MNLGRSLWTDGPTAATGLLVSEPLVQPTAEKTAVARIL